jgi:hypothetical protein
VLGHLAILVSCNPLNVANAVAPFKSTESNKSRKNTHAYGLFIIIIIIKLPDQITHAYGLLQERDAHHHCQGGQEPPGVR